MVICGSFLKWIPGNNICRGNVVQQCLVTMDWPFPHFLVNEVQYLPRNLSSVFNHLLSLSNRIQRKWKNMNLQKYYFSFALYLID